MPSYRAKPVSKGKPANGAKPKMPMHKMPESHKDMTPTEHQRAMAINMEREHRLGLKGAYKPAKKRG